MVDPAKTPNVIERLQGSVHTYDSFGRAIVSSALSAAAKAAASGIESEITATIHVKPLSTGKTFSAASEAGHVGKSGHVDGSALVVVCVFDHCHVFEV